MNNYKYVGQPLTPGIAQELIIELFTGETVRTQEIKRIVDQTHQERGGQRSNARTHHPVSLALSSHMKPAGLAKNIEHGSWQIFSSPQDGEEGNSEDTEMDEEIVEPGFGSEKIVGTGGGSVYLYYYPTYRLFAESQNESVWPCKIGMAEYDAAIRIYSQAGTALPEFPEVGFIIKTDDPEMIERTLQSILTLRRKHKEDAPGREWFITSPDEIEDIYQNILGSSQ